ncbi:pentatricopeptide repeat-containing protein At1g08070, chloroplastic-like [Humulus lupulus]|uniref:pentatricopeptide repeat-containing protein At1g08070, chloroplastic-like n=1 Tax=Humulus lupulus TaxID=3486 RepID=UPI002B41832D|nr:pentatricopeptide repeat-containing protein At1g08070, chloroplastic-like [Humulus lupulus]
MPPNSLYIRILSENIRETIHNCQPKLEVSHLQVITYLWPKCKNKQKLLQIQAQLITTGLIQNPPIASKLIASFASSSLPTTISIAHSIGTRVEGLDTFTWNTIIRGYLDRSNAKQALLVYSHVRSIGLNVDSYSLQFVIKACGLISAVLEGKQIHAQKCKLGFSSEVIVQTALMDMYNLFGELVFAQQVFDETPQRDTVMWNSVLALYAQHNLAHEALVYARAMAYSGLRLNGVSVVSVLSACSSLKALREGKVVHGYLIRHLTDIDILVYNTLIDMYSKCGSLWNAHQIFRVMPIKNVVSWTSMINAYSYSNLFNEGLALFQEMEGENVRPDEVTMLSIVSICSKLGSFELGDWIDHYMEKNELKVRSTTMSNALMDMYAKCGNIEKACKVFDWMIKKTLVSWTTIIHGLAMHGYAIPALLRFSQMQREGFKPDGVVFLSILSACSHAGLADEGRKCFNSMIQDYHMKPGREHYGCMIDLLCRGGLVNEAFEFVQSMPEKPDMIVWRMLVGACRNQGDISLADEISSHLHEMRPKSSEDYGLLSNTYAVAGQWVRVNEIRKEMKIKGFMKLDPGCSSIETLKI